MKFFKLFFSLFIFHFSFSTFSQSVTLNFNKDWKFQLASDTLGTYPENDHWRKLDVPHDWSIEGNFSDKYNTTFNEGALPAGIGWYRKEFILPSNFNNKKVFINFEGVFCNCEVWINDHYLGKRPNGYVPFQYELTQYLKFNGQQNILKVKVDNSLQPNTRYYTGSGIYRSVSLVAKEKIYFSQYSVFVTTPSVNQKEAVVKIENSVVNDAHKKFQLQYSICDADKKIVANKLLLNPSSQQNFNQEIKIVNPKLWSTKNPYLYSVVVKIIVDRKVLDVYESKLGIRTFRFDAATGFYLNEKPLKILGVCNHHDLGALGAAVNKFAIKRQLLLLKEMGCNAIRTAHNPPATELLDLCDEMGFLVMDEAFDMWVKKKNKFDYAKDFKQWHKADLEAMILRDRNHPSVFMWSIGNEIREQFDSSGTRITKELIEIVKAVDHTRPVTSALTENIPSKNFITQSNSLDVLGFNYKHLDYDSLPKRFPDQSFVATETASALESRSVYELPADSFRVWPPDAKTTKTGNASLSCNAYDNTFAYWGTTHEQSWLAVKNRKFMSGLFVWCGFDFLGEPVPYQYPARSSYYGVIDLAGFQKDVYYMYQSEWSEKSVLHILPHWNWSKGDTVDVWAYYNHADEVELFLNGKSLGTKYKSVDVAHVAWKVPYESGRLKAISRKNGKTVLEKEIKTADTAAKIILTTDKRIFHHSENELCFIKASVVDKNGEIVPDTQNEITFSVASDAKIIATDNGSPTDLTPFQTNKRKAYNGVCLLIVKPTISKGSFKIVAKSRNLQSAELLVEVQ